MELSNKKSITCSIVGAPNVGKSTLLNQLIGFKLSIVANKPQTTRKSIKGILNYQNTQIVFIDTPGLFKHPKMNALQRQIVKDGWGNLKTCNLILLTIDTENAYSPVNDLILENAKIYNIPVVLLVNKSDEKNLEERIDAVKTMNEKFNFENIFYISAKKGSNCTELIKYLSSKAQQDGFIFEDDLISDEKPDDILIEFIREYFFNKLKLEIPYGINLEIESKKENGEEILYHVLISVIKENHKKILIGKAGENIKNAIKHAIFNTSYLFTKKLIIKIFVKVDENWIKNYNQ
jgi:GTP-binding protein Era